MRQAPRYIARSTYELHFLRFSYQKRMFRDRRRRPDQLRKTAAALPRIEQSAVCHYVNRRDMPALNKDCRQDVRR